MPAFRRDPATTRQVELLDLVVGVFALAGATYGTVALAALRWLRADPYGNH